MYGLNQFEVNQDLFGGFCLENKQTKKKKMHLAWDQPEVLSYHIFFQVFPRR